MNQNVFYRNAMEKHQQSSVSLNNASYLKQGQMSFIK